MKHLTGLGTDWDIYCKPAMLVYNSYASPNLADISPFELVEERQTYALNLSLNHKSL